ncbi:Calpain-type cysteine protease ADL1 [Fusarium oxysporum f. sp. albedinis]|nr:Calpain-type cysteine protease ADL1 [Fusarium oxysporum f. sp. albedinis]
MALRIKYLITSGTPPTPSVSHINKKLQKAYITLAVNGITATQEIRRLKEKNLRRSTQDQRTTILANYRLITIYDARLRVTKDQHNRLAGQAAKEAHYIQSTAVIGLRYQLYRKLLAKSKDPKVKATNTKELESQEAPREALEFIISNKEKRRSNQKKISLKANDLEIVKDNKEIDKNNKYNNNN